ncbi:MAG: DUF1080 domain-containing protein [Gemmataceae bacterium]
MVRYALVGLLRYALAGLLLAALTLGAQETPQSEEGFRSLFNGKDLSGWTYRGSKENLDGQTQTADGRFVVEAGVIVAKEKDKNGRGGIKVLDTVFTWPKDFELRLQFKAGLKADSGVYVRGAQLQVRDFPRRGEQKQLKKFKNDDWNELQIIVRNQVTSTVLNGKALTNRDNLQATFRDGKLSVATLNGKAVEVKSLTVRKGAVAECFVNGEFLEKMANIPENGPIGLQAETGPFAFRNIRIKELK